MNTSDSLPSDVAARLIEERDAATDGLLALIRERGDGDFTPQAAQEHIHLIRRLAVIDAALRGRGYALTQDELAWLETQGVRMQKTLARLRRDESGNEP
jgi:hypothetical protein